MIQDRHECRIVFNPSLLAVKKQAKINERLQILGMTPIDSDLEMSLARARLEERDAVGATALASLGISMLALLVAVFAPGNVEMSSAGYMVPFLLAIIVMFMATIKANSSATIHAAAIAIMEYRIEQCRHIVNAPNGVPTSSSTYCVVSRESSESQGARLEIRFSAGHS